MLQCQKQKKWFKYVEGISRVSVQYSAVSFASCGIVVGSHTILRKDAFDLRNRRQLFHLNLCTLQSTFFSLKVKQSTALICIIEGRKLLNSTVMETAEKTYPCTITWYLFSCGYKTQKLFCESILRHFYFEQVCDA